MATLLLTILGGTVVAAGTGAVEVIGSARSRLRRCGAFGCFLLADVRQTSPGAQIDVTSSVRGAIEVANRSVPPWTVTGTFAAMTSKGVGFAVHAFDYRDGEIDAWLTALVSELERQHLGGRIRNTGNWGPGLDALGRASGYRTYPAAFAGYTLDNYAPRTEPGIGWQVAPGPTSVVTTAIQDWMRTEDEDMWAMLHGNSISLPPDATGDLLAAVAGVSPFGMLLNCVDLGRTRDRRAALSHFGQVVTQTINPDVRWEQLLDEQIQLLLANPTACDVGLIKDVYAMANGWGRLEVQGDYQHLPVRLTLDYQCNRHLWDEFVIDAAGVSLLTAKHLEHAHDLSGWNVEEVAPDRFLVKASDLAAWYSGIVPTPDVIASARADFGDMVLTWDTIVARPGPYSQRDPFIVGR